MNLITPIQALDYVNSVKPPRKGWRYMEAVFGFNGERHSYKQTAEIFQVRVTAVRCFISVNLRLLKKRFGNDFHFLIGGKRVSTMIGNRGSRKMDKPVSDEQVDFENNFIKKNLAPAFNLAERFSRRFCQIETSDAFSIVLDEFWKTARHFDRSRATKENIDAFMLNSARMAAWYGLQNELKKFKCVTRGFGAKIIRLDSEFFGSGHDTRHSEISSEESLYA